MRRQKLSLKFTETTVIATASFTSFIRRRFQNLEVKFFKCTALHMQVLKIIKKTIKTKSVTVFILMQGKLEFVRFNQKLSVAN